MSAEANSRPGWHVKSIEDQNAGEQVEAHIIVRCVRDNRGELVPGTVHASIDGHALLDSRRDGDTLGRLGDAVLGFIEVAEVVSAPTVLPETLPNPRSTS